MIDRFLSYLAASPATVSQPVNPARDGMASQNSSDKIDLATGHGVVLSTECVFTDTNEGITDTPLLNTSGLVHPEAEREAIANVVSEANQITANSLTVTNSTSLAVQTASTIAATSTLQSVAATKAVQINSWFCWPNYICIFKYRTSHC